MQKLKRLIKIALVRFESFVDRTWYEYALAILAGLDHFIIVIPTDGLIISSTLLAPKKWYRFAVWTALGSAVGGFALAFLAAFWGLPWVEMQFPALLSSGAWAWTAKLFENYGLWVLFLVAATPIMTQPAIILSVLAHHHGETIFGVTLAGRLLKYLVMAGLSRYAPKYLRRLWGVQAELKEIGVKPPVI